MATNNKELRKEVLIHDTPEQFVGYANINGITLTPEEAVMHLGVRRPDNPNEADGVAKIYFSLPHIKRIAIVLAEIIKEHEVLFGEILEPNARLTEGGRKILEKRLGQQNVTDDK